jgi:hypothetical protein
VESLTAGMLYTPKTKTKPYDNAADRLFLVPFEEFGVPSTLASVGTIAAGAAASSGCNKLLAGAYCTAL